MFYLGFKNYFPLGGSKAPPSVFASLKPHPPRLIELFLTLKK
nr:MAG TPA: hypothetical protein [Caudoviricetes sp.]